MERWIATIILIILVIVSTIKSDKNKKDIKWHLICIISGTFLTFVLTPIYVEAFAKISGML